MTRRTEDALIVGGGFAGLSCAITLAEHGLRVRVIEAAPRLGGRAGSFFEPRMGQWIDQGPHLLIGAYRHTLDLLRRCNAEHLVHWQSSLQLPLWDPQRGRFALHPSPRLPLAIALPRALAMLPGHSFASVPAMLRLRFGQAGTHETVVQWLQRVRAPHELVRDFLEPLCLAAMNEHMDTANARSFQRVLVTAFANHAHARLGWFRQPLGLCIETLAKHARSLGVCITTHTQINGVSHRAGMTVLRSQRGEEFRAPHAVATVPPWHQHRLSAPVATPASNPITNIHLWFDEQLRLPYPFIGGLGTQGQWFFDVSAQTRQRSTGSHLCVVISAFHAGNKRTLVDQACSELARIMERKKLPEPCHSRVVCVRRATVLVRPHLPPNLPTGIVDSMEHPAPGQLPATIEYAIERGKQGAERVLARCQH